MKKVTYLFLTAGILCLIFAPFIYGQENMQSNDQISLQSEWDDYVKRCQGENEIRKKVKSSWEDTMSRQKAKYDFEYWPGRTKPQRL